MNYSVHTFEMKKYYRTWTEYNQVCEFIKSDAKENGYNILYNEGDKDIPVSKFKGCGIRVLMHTQYGCCCIRFIINLHAVLHTYDPMEIISPDEAEEALDKANDMLVGWLGPDYSIDKLTLTRVDCCVNVDVGSPEYVAAYIKQFYRTNAVKAFKTVNPKKQGFNKEAGYTAEYKAAGEEISVYDKQKQVEYTRFGVSYPRAEGILRVEFRHKNESIRQSFGYGSERNRENILYYIYNSRHIIKGKLEKFIVDADYYKTDKAQRLIIKKVTRGKLCNRMCRFVALVSKHRGILRAREAHNAENRQVTGKYYKVMRKAFGNINVNPVPLPTASEFKMLPSLFRFLE